MSTTIHPAVRRQTIADALRRTAIRLPAKTGIVCGATSWTYAEFDALVTRLAAGLARIGVAEGDKVAVLARSLGTLKVKGLTSVNSASMSHRPSSRS